MPLSGQAKSRTETKPGDYARGYEVKATNQVQVPSAAEQQATDTKPIKSKTAKSKQQAKPTAAAKPAPKAAVPSQEGSMAAFMDALVLKTTDPAKLQAALTKEAQRRGVKALTLGALRSHVKYRQARGKLVGVEIAAE